MDNLELMRKRLEWRGGIKQEDRMIKDKYRTFLRTLKYSYQGCDVQLVQHYEHCLEDDYIIDEPSYRALINPDKVKQDYDDKILSIDYASKYQPGDIFQWEGTQTNWIIYLEQLTEDAYFRGEIRLCRYKIKFKDENGKPYSTWASVRGPVETQINSLQKNQIRKDTPNLTLNILMPLNDKTKTAFDRYYEFLFAGKCWQVNTANYISMKNIIEVTAEEYYINRDTDDVINELKDGLIIEPVDPTPDSGIVGETFIKPKITEFYSVDILGGKWKILEDFPVQIKKVDDTKVAVTWNKATSGQFTLQWSKDDITYSKVIVVESLF